MSVILLASISIRLAALAWSLVLMRRLGDWRIGLFSAMFGLMALRQSLTLMNRPIDESLLIAGDLSETPGLAVSVLSFLALIFVGRMIGEQAASSHDQESSKPAIGMAGQAVTKPSLSLEFLGPRVFGAPSVALVLGISLSLASFEFVRDWEEARATRGFEREAIAQAASLRHEISLSVDTVLSIRGLYAASAEVERAEFRAFVASEMAEEHRGIQALEWIPRVAAADRAAFEEAARADGLAGFGFTERESQGRMVAAAARPEYFPVYFVEPLAGNEAALGFDLGSNPARLAALDKARDSGETTATERITLVQETGDQYGFLVFEPIYRKGAPAGTVAERRAALQGFGLGVLRLGDIVATSLEHFDHRAGVVDMFVFDNSAPAGQRLLHPRSAPVEDRADISVAGCVDTPLRVGGRDWLFVHCPTGETVVPGHWQSWAVLIVGLAMTSMLALYLLSMLRQRARTERLAEGLRVSEERYRGLFDNAHDMIQSVDAEGRFIFVNRAWMEAMGYTLDELDGVNVFDLIAPESKAHCLDAFKAIMAGEAQDNVPLTFVRKDGGRLEAEGNIAPQVSAGRIVATQGIFRDVTERKAHEERERTTRIEQQRIAGELAQLIDTANAPIFGVDVRGLVNEWNQRAASITGYAKDEVMGRDLVAEFITDDYRAAVKQVLDKALAGEETANFEFPLFTKSGARVDVLLNATTRRDVAGAIIGVVGIGQDITERKQAENALHESEARFRGVVENVTDGFATIDENGRVESFNPAAERMFGYAAEEVIGHNVSVLMPEPDRGRHDGYLRRYLRTGVGKIIGHGQREVTARRKDGSSFPMELMVSKMFLGDKRMFVGVMRDITEHKRIEAELIQAAKMATLGEMATGVAHELNQPLNVIRMAADSTLERVEEGDFDAGYLRGKLERISAQTERAAAIIDHMRIFGRKTDEKPELIDLRDVTRDALGLIGEQLRLGGIEVETDLPEACRPVSGHAVQLEQVVLNLLGNARDAIEANRQEPERPRKITVTVEDAGPEDKVRLIVEDSGGGIPDRIIDRIFEPFFTTKQTGKGTGLGLSISYGIVTDMGGAIEAANAGGGARITITLPVAAEQTSAPRRREAR